MNITPLLDSLSRIPDLTVKGGALNLARMSAGLKTAATGTTTGTTTGSTPATTPGTTTGSTVPTGGLANQSVFLQLLVAQLKNQDPQNPADGTSFVTQLAQFTTLEQDTQSAQDLNKILALLQASNGKTSTGQSTAAA